MMSAAFRTRSPGECVHIVKGVGACQWRFGSTSTAIDVEVRAFETHKCSPPSTTVSTNRDELMGWFETMFRMRRMESESDKLYKDRLIRGFCHLYDGQEAVVTGLHAASKPSDSIITSYRDHALHLMRGGSVKEVFGELLGRAVGASRGVGGSMHFYNKANNFYGGCGIVGAQVPIGAGLALAHQMQGDGNIAFALYGDGAANQGQIAETLNMSALWQVPIIFVCENNQYGMGTSSGRASKSPDFYKRGDYVPGIRVDGMDVLAMKQATAWARKYVLEHGPLCFEADTYRYHGHSMSDPGSTYRTRGEVTEMRYKRDPIERVRRLLLETNLAEQEELKAVERSVVQEVKAAIEECKAAATPDASTLQTNLYVEPCGHQLRGTLSDRWIAADVKPYH